MKKGGQTKQWRAALQLLREGIQSGLKMSPGPYIAIASACRKGGRWQLALSLLSEMREAKLESNVIIFTIQGELRARRASAPIEGRGFQGALRGPRHSCHDACGGEEGPKRLTRLPKRPRRS